VREKRIGRKRGVALGVNCKQWFLEEFSWWVLKEVSGERVVGVQGKV